MNKRILFLLLCLIAMLSVSAVSAVDENVTEDVLNDNADSISSASVFETDGMKNNLYANEDYSSEDQSYDDSDLNLNNLDSNSDITPNQVFKDISEDNQEYGDSNNVKIMTSNIVMYYHDGSRIACHLIDDNGPLANKTVTFDINGYTYDRTTDYNGQASVACNLGSGIYPVTVFYGNISSSMTVTVLSTIVASDFVKNYGDTPLFYATFLRTDGTVLENTEVSFLINGKYYYNVTGTDGTAYLNITLNPGNYTVTAYNPYDGEKMKYNGTIVGILPDMVIDIGETIENKNISINVTLPDDATGIVNLSVDKYKFESSLVNGVAMFNIPGLSNGAYLLNVTYFGDKKYPSNSITKNLVIMPDETPSLYVNNVSKYYKGSEVLWVCPLIAENSKTKKYT